MFLHLFDPFDVVPIVVVVFYYYYHLLIYLFICRPSSSESAQIRSRQGNPVAEIFLSL